MTKTVREKESTNLPLNRLYAVFRLHYTTETNKHDSRAEFFGFKRERGESASDVWKRILETEQNREFEEIKAAEILTSNLPSIIGNNTGDKELKKKIKRGNLMIEEITEAIH